MEETAPVQTPASQIVYAGVGRRWVASFLDGLILMIPNVVVGAILGLLSAVVGDKTIIDVFSGLGTLISFVIAFGYYIYFIGKSGQTLGKKALGVKVVRVDGGEPVGYTNAFLREVVGKFLTTIALGLGYLWALWDPKKQTWHDKIAKTVVVKV